MGNQLKPGDLGGMPTLPRTNNPNLPGGLMPPGAPIAPPAVGSYADLDMPAGPGEAFEDDFAGVSPSEYRALQPGLYAGRLLDVTCGPNKARTGERYEWEFEVLGAGNGQKRKIWTARTVDARWKIAQTLAAFGIDAYEKRVRWARADVIGKLVVLEIKASEYEKEDAFTREIQVFASDTLDRVWPMEYAPGLFNGITEADQDSLDDIPF